MDRLVYIAASGAKQMQLAQTASAHNIANLSTTGFQADLAAFRAMPMYGPGHATRVYAMSERPAVDMSNGIVHTTGRELDIAVNGNGWIAVQGLDGKEGYTRAGDLRVNNVGQLITGVGHPVLGDGGPIAVPPFEKIEIGADGSVSVIPVGQAATTMAVVGRIKLVNPPADQLERGAAGMLRLRDDQVAPADADVRVLSGSLESSNVNAVAAMVNLIELARSYETQVKLMKAAEDNDAASARMMQMA